MDGPREGVATVTLNRPEKRNALSIAVRDAVSDALDRLTLDDDVKVVVVTGAGEVFSAGFDLREFEQPEIAEQLWASSDRFHRAWLEFPLPTVAAVNGPALAGGFDLAVMCDVRVASSTARFAHPELAFGDVVYGPLHDLVGGSVARDLCLTGRILEAAEALTLGWSRRWSPATNWRPTLPRRPAPSLAPLATSYCAPRPSSSAEQMWCPARRWICSSRKAGRN